MTATMMVPRVVSWDQGEPLRYEALLEADGHGRYVREWNGWLCPLLPRAAIDQMMADTAPAAGDMFQAMTWDGDVLVLSPLPVYETDEVERIEPTYVRGVPHWTPGSFSWTWTAVECGWFLMCSRPAVRLEPVPFSVDRPVPICQPCSDRLARQVAQIAARA